MWGRAAGTRGTPGWESQCGDRSESEAAARWKGELDVTAHTWRASIDLRVSISVVLVA